MQPLEHAGDAGEDRGAQQVLVVVVAVDVERLPRLGVVEAGGHAEAVEQGRADVGAQHVVGGDGEAQLGEHVREGRRDVGRRVDDRAVEVEQHGRPGALGRDGLGGHGGSHRVILGCIP